MKKLKYKFDTTDQAFKSLELAWKYFDTELDKLSLADNLDLKKIARDSVIQRFEYTAELSWKLIYNYLQVKHLQEDMEVSPLTVLRYALKVKLLNEEEVNQAIDMIKDRNTTSHMYKEEVAILLIDKIPQHIKLISKIVKAIKQELRTN